MALLDTYRSLGARGTASYALLRLTARLRFLDYRRYLLVAQPRAGLPTMPRGFGWRTLDVQALAGQDLALDPATIRFRLGQGMTCVAAVREGRVVGVNWLKAGPFDEDEVEVRFVPPPGAAWDTGLFVHPRARGGRAFAAVWAGSAAWLDSQGLGWSMSRIADYNSLSWESHRRMGAERVGTLVVLRCGSWQLASGCAPLLAAVGGRRPVARLSLPVQPDPPTVEAAPLAHGVRLAPKPINSARRFG